MHPISLMPRCGGAPEPALLSFFLTFTGETRRALTDF
jgi:hypothetical protein